MNNLRTVGDFTQEGLVFADGDSIESKTGAVFFERLGKGGAAFINGEQPSDGEDYIAKSFAFRTNTDGLTPSFKGEVEYETRNGSSGVCPITMLAFDLLNLNPCIKWRPHLDLTPQAVMPTGNVKPVLNEAGYIARGFIDRCVVIPTKPSDFAAHVSDAGKAKPVFTQAMADKGELPPVGVELIIEKETCCSRIDKFLGDPILVIGTCHNNGKYVITWSHPRYGLCCGNYSKEVFKVFDTRTNKEKAVAEMYKLWHECDTGDIESSFNAIYDAGYRK